MPVVVVVVPVAVLVVVAQVLAVAQVRVALMVRVPVLPAVSLVLSAAWAVWWGLERQWLRPLLLQGRPRRRHNPRRARRARRAPTKTLRSDFKKPRSGLFLLPSATGSGIQCDRLIAPRVFLIL